MSKLTPGQVAVVTGAATGIGYALAEAFVSRGLRVVIADIDEQRLESAAQALRDRGGEVLPLALDLSQRDAVYSMRDRALAAFGRVDILCNNAGVYYPMAPVWQVDITRWRGLFELNYWAVVHGIQAFVPLFIEQGAGHMVNTASMSGLSIVPGSGDYGSAKHAIVALSETLRAELDMAGAIGVGVTLLCPSLVNTPMGERALEYFANSSLSGSREVNGSGPDLSAVLEPAQLAQAALEGIEQDRLHVLPTPNSRERFAKRVQLIFDAFSQRLQCE